MESLVRYLTAEWGVILQAPAIFATAVVLVAAVIRGIVGWSYSIRLETLEGRLKLRDDQISDYRQKLSGATPDEARQKMDDLEKKLVTLLPRRLNENQKKKLIEVLQNHYFIIHICTDMSAGDVQKLSKDIAGVFTAAGWQVTESGVFGLPKHPVSGTALCVSNPLELNITEKLVSNAFRSVDIPFEIQAGGARVVPIPGQPPNVDGSPKLMRPDAELLFTVSLD